MRICESVPRDVRHWLSFLRNSSAESLDDVQNMEKVWIVHLILILEHWQYSDVIEWANRPWK